MLRFSAYHGIAWRHVTMATRGADHSEETTRNCAGPFRCLNARCNGRQEGRRIPRRFIRLRSVLGCISRILAAPFGPSTTHRVDERTSVM